MIVNVYVVKDNENGVCSDGTSGCFDLYIPVKVSVPKTSATLRASLEALLNIPTTEGCYGGDCTLRSALYLSHFQVSSAAIVDGVARVKLTGEQAFAGDRDGSRAVEQITRTITRFPSVKNTDITVNGKPLKCLADLSGTCGDSNASGMIPVKLYFGDEKVIEEVDCAATRPVTRYIPKTAAVADATLRILLQGVTPEEEAQGLTSVFDNSSGYFDSAREPSNTMPVEPLLIYYRGISIANGVATVKFTGGAMIYLNNTACMQGIVKAPIFDTLLQFPSIKNVQFSVDGKVITDWDG